MIIQTKFTASWVNSQTFRFLNREGTKPAKFYVNLREGYYPFALFAASGYFRLSSEIQARSVSPTACKLAAETLSAVSAVVCQYG